MAEEDQDLVEVQIDGETQTLPRDVVEKIQQGGNWTRELTHKSETVATRERALAQREETLAQREARLSEAEAQDPERNIRGEDAVEEAGIDVSQLPSPLDDPEAYNQALGKLLQQAATQGYTRARDEFKKMGDQIRTEAATADAKSEGRRVDLQSNKETIDAYAKRMEQEGTPLTPAQRKEVVDYMNTQLRMPHQGYGQRTQNGVFVFTESALEAADRAVRSKYWDQRAYERGRLEGLGQNPNAADLSGSRLQAPAADASMTDKVQYALSLPPNSKALQDYVDGMSDEENNAFLLESQRFMEHEAMTGALPQ